MIPKDPNDFPPEEEPTAVVSPTPDGEDPSEHGMFIGSIFVNAAIQGGLTFWDRWILLSITGVTINALLWWIGMTLIFVSLDHYKKDMTGHLIVWKVLLSFSLTIWIWIL